MPSHLREDASKRRKYDDLFVRGVISEADLVANDAADELAQFGAAMHEPFPPGMMWALVDSKRVTQMTQSFMQGVWKRFEEADSDEGAVTEEDFELQELERAMREQ